MRSYEETYYETNGVRLHVVQAGPEDGPLVILLHGFPEFWYGWRAQIGPLAEASFRVLAPDQRGYNLSDKPRGVAAYRLETLVQDVVGLIQAAGHQKANIVGHDWGAIVAWALAVYFPDRVERLGIMNVPHPEVVRQLGVRIPEQWLRSSYILFFQIPGLPEMILRNRDWEQAAQALLRTSRPGTFSHEDLEQYRRAWWRKDAMTSMLNWYRALVRMPAPIPENSRIRVPTLMLWGVNDVAISRKLAEPSIHKCDQGQLIFYEDATHWVQHEEAESVNAHLIHFLRTTTQGPAAAGELGLNIH